VEKVGSLRVLTCPKPSSGRKPCPKKAGPAGESSGLAWPQLGKNAFRSERLVGKGAAYSVVVDLGNLDGQRMDYIIHDSLESGSNKER
jgi:hypothetical protein